jgi:hypothetical protein
MRYSTVLIERALKQTLNASGNLLEEKITGCKVSALQGDYTRDDVSEIRVHWDAMLAEARAHLAAACNTLHSLQYDVRYGAARPLSERLKL